MALVCELGSAMSFCSEIWSSAELNNKKLKISKNISLFSILFKSTKHILIYFDADARTLLLFGHHYHLQQKVQLDDEVQMNISREISKDIITTTLYMYDQFLDG